jgi:hypothetical protein
MENLAADTLSACERLTVGQDPKRNTSLCFYLCHKTTCESPVPAGGG